jgi:protease PrsW
MNEKKMLGSKKGRKSLWLSNISTFLLLALFLLLVFGVEKLIKPEFSPETLLLSGVILSLIPAAIWLVFFYRQDRLEPEPKALILEVFLLGGLLAGSIGIPLVNLYNLPIWLYDNFWVNLVGAVLVIGFSQEFLKYAAVRFSIFNSAEFDERIDGIIYATAAGLGFATALNITFVVSSGGVNLGMGAIRIVLTALAQASFAGITGYFLGKEKFEKKPVWWMPLGLALAAALNGIFYTLWGTLMRGRISVSGGFVNPWAGLILASVLALGITFILSWLIERDLRKILEAVEA